MFPNKNLYKPLKKSKSMGRIKTTLTKRNAKKLIADNPKVFKKNFKENKELVSQLAEFNSKKLRNIIAGYVTRLTKQAED